MSWNPTRPPHRCNFAAALSSAPIPTIRYKLPRKKLFKFSAANCSPLPKSRIGTKPGLQLQFGTTFSLLLLYQHFTALFPHLLSSFSSTSVLPFSRNALLRCGYVSAIGLVVADGLHCSRMERSICPERWFTDGDAAGSAYEENANSKLPPAACLTRRAPP